MKVFQMLLAVSLMASAIQAGQISASLKQRLSRGEKIDIMVELSSIDDIHSSQSILALTGEAKVQALVSALKARTSASQQPFVDILARLGLSESVEEFWIDNKLSVKNADESVIAALASVPGDFLIREPFTAHLIEPVESAPVNITGKQGQLQYGVKIIGSEEAWKKTRGENIIIGIIDSGVLLGHEALKNNFAGAWKDPYYSKPTPDDVNGHGTHALGSACGTANGIGVAPGAKWVACRGFDNEGSATESALTMCGQFMLSDANPRPHVVSNSWTGGVGQTWYNAIINSWRAAGIVPVFALGNTGPSCKSANSPGDQPNVISVGATTATDTMASFSSRGPGPNNSQKPEVSAPGNAIISASNSGTTSYSTKSGTSMATPHVAGAVALIMSANPGITFDEILTALQTTADHPPVSNADVNCGGNGVAWPNMAYGHGRINVGKAV